MTSTVTEMPKVMETPKKAKRERKSWSVRMDGADGSSLKLMAWRTGEGAVTFAVHTTKDAKGKKVNARGATEQHKDVATARARLEKLAGDAAKIGWRRREGKRGFERRPDAFDATRLPVPGKGKK